MRAKLNSYVCPKCRKIIKRRSDKQWIRSYCEAIGKMTRIMLIKKRIK